MMGLFRLAYSKYQRDGIGPLVMRTPTYFLREKFLFSHYFQHQILEEDDLQSGIDSVHIFGKYESGQEFEIEPTDESKKLNWNFRKWEDEYSEDNSFIYEVKNARLLGPEGIAFTQNDRPILNSGQEHYKRFNYGVYSMSSSNHFRSLKPSLFSPDCRYTAAFPMVADPGNFYTWVTEYLPKLKGLKRYMKSSDNEPVIILRENPPDFMIESLEFFGFDRSNIVKLSEKIVEIEKLILCTHRRHNVGGRYVPHRSGYEWLRREAANKLDTRNGQEKIYISRHDVGKRHALNEDEVMSELEKFGFERIVLSDLTFEDQILKFFNADLVTGIHGAGFANLVWSDSPTFVEIISSDKIKNSQGPTYYCLSRALGYKYDYLFSEGNYEDGVQVNIPLLINIIRKYH